MTEAVVTDSMSNLTLAAAADPTKLASTQLPGSEGDAGEAIVVRLFIGDLGQNTTEASLRAYFEQFGPVDRVTIKHPSSRAWQRLGGGSARPGGSGPYEHRSFGFITVGQELAQSLMNVQHVIDGVAVSTPEIAKPARSDKVARRNEVTQAPSAADQSKGWGGNSHDAPRKIFVGGISHQTKEHALETYFAQFGPITDVVVMTEGSSRRPRGFGFVTFEHAESVTAITRTRYHPIEGRLVEVKAAVPRDVMQHMPPGQTGAPGTESIAASEEKSVGAPKGGPPDDSAGSYYEGFDNSMAPSGYANPDWFYPNGTNYGNYATNNMIPSPLMMGPAYDGSSVQHGVPVYNGYAPGYAPQMMVPMGHPGAQSPTVNKPMHPPAMIVGSVPPVPPMAPPMLAMPMVPPGSPTQPTQFYPTAVPPAAAGATYPMLGPSQAVMLPSVGPQAMIPPAVAPQVVLQPQPAMQPPAVPQPMMMAPVSYAGCTPASAHMDFAPAASFMAGAPRGGMPGAGTAPSVAMNDASLNMRGAGNPSAAKATAPAPASEEAVKTEQGSAGEAVPGATPASEC